MVLAVKSKSSSSCTRDFFCSRDDPDSVSEYDLFRLVRRSDEFCVEQEETLWTTWLAVTDELAVDALDTFDVEPTVDASGVPDDKRLLSSRSEQ